MLAEFAVVEPDDQAQLGIETPGGEGRPDVDLVVVVDEREGRRLGHSRFHEDIGVELPGLDEPWRFGVARPAVGVAGGGAVRPGHDRRHPADEGGGPATAGERGGIPAFGAHGRDDEGDLFPVDVTQFTGQPVTQRVVAAHDHVAGLRAVLYLRRKLRQ